MGLVQILLVLGVSWLAGQAFRLIRLPSLLGMLAGGLAVSSLVFPVFPQTDPGSFQDLSSPIRLAILAIILLRAGQGLSSRDLRQAGGLAVGLGIIPMLGDAALVTVGSMWLLDLPLSTALVLGFLVAAISPAIVIPAMTELLEARKGPDRRVPAALLAGAPLDNIGALVGLGVALELALSSRISVWSQMAHVPLSLGGGILAGAAAAMALSALPGQWMKRRWIGAATAWATACLTIAACQALDSSLVMALLVLGFVLRLRAPALSDELGKGLATMWSVGQYALFGLIGAALDPTSVGQVGLLAVAIILAGQVGRVAGVLLATSRSRLNQNERLACVIGYLPKATIQAAFAAVPLERGLARGNDLLSVGILAVVLMAPIGLVAIHAKADYLLPRSKTGC